MKKQQKKKWKQQLQEWIETQYGTAGWEMKLDLESILIVLVSAIISAFLIAGMCFGIKLIIEGIILVEELKSICVSCV